MRHAPTTLERLGECQVQLGKLVVGTETLRRVVRETLPPNSPPAFVASQERARQILAEATPKLAQLKIAVAVPADAEFSVTVDGETVPGANLNVNRPMDPGEHVIEASGPRLLPSKTKVKLQPGGSDSVALTLQLDPNARPTPPPATLTLTPPSGLTTSPLSPTPQPSPNHAAAYAALAVGGVGVVIGTIFGITAISAKSSLDSACNNKVCPSTQQDSLDSAKTKGNISTVAFIVGGLGVGLGATLYLTNAFSGTSSSSSAVTVQPYVSAGGAGLTGAF
jgi:hypothetical protein